MILARLITFNLAWLDDPLRFKIGRLITPLLTHTHAHSVLSGNVTIPSPEPVVLHEVAALTLPIHFGILFVGDFLFACALIAIGAMLHSFAATGHSTLRVAADPISSSSYRISIFCLKLLGLNVISSWIISYTAPFVTSFLNRNGLEKLFSISLRSQIALESSPLLIDLIDHLWILPITLCVVYVMAPLQLQLLQPPNIHPTPNQKKDARLCGMCAAVAISALGVVVFAAQHGLFQLIFRTDRNTYLIGAVASIIRAIPYGPLYVTFYLIAIPKRPLATPSDTPPNAIG